MPRIPYIPTIKKMTRKKDYKIINSKKCMHITIIDGNKFTCGWESYAMAEGKFLCKIHFRAIKPQKERHYRQPRTRGLFGEKFKWYA